MYSLLLKELRFKIGEQYELNEFNLKTIESTFENDIEYDNYEYIRSDFNALFGVRLSRNIILQYNAEILCKVIYEFDKVDCKNLLDKITCYLPVKNKIFKDLSTNDMIEITELDDGVFLRMIKNTSNLIVSMSC